MCVCVYIYIYIYIYIYTHIYIYIYIYINHDNNTTTTTTTTTTTNSHTHNKKHKSCRTRRMGPCPSTPTSGRTAPPGCPGSGGSRRGPKGRLAKGRKQCGLKHNETYRTPIFCTVPLPKVPLVPPKVRAGGARPLRLQARRPAAPERPRVALLAHTYIHIGGER